LNNWSWQSAESLTPYLFILYILGLAAVEMLRRRHQQHPHLRSIQ
jgi:hypothetical protein